jgi:tetratricopeptide (TPR) repeat protein
MTKFLRIISCFAVLAILVSPLAAQQSQQQNPPPAQPPGKAPGNPGQPAAPAVNPAEEADYKAFLAIPRTDTEKQFAAGEEFLKKYPESTVNELIYGRLATIAFSKNDVTKAMTLADKGLALNPDNLDLLPIVALVLTRTTDPNAMDYLQKMERAEQSAKRAILMIESMTKPESLTEEEFNRARNEKLSMCYSGLGVIYFRREQFADSAAQLEKAVQSAAQPDPLDLYILGVDYQNVSRFADAVTVFEKCSQIRWSWQSQCKQSMDQAKKQAAAQPKQP